MSSDKAERVALKVTVFYTKGFFGNKTTQEVQVFQLKEGYVLQGVVVIQDENGALEVSFDQSLYGQHMKIGQGLRKDLYFPRIRFSSVERVVVMPAFEE